MNTLAHHMLTHRVLVCLALSAASITAGLGACSKNEPAPAAQANAPVETYSCRGKIVALPDAKGAMLQIHHEAIPTFKSKSGETIGMKQMIMPFGLAPAMSLADFKQGDAVEFTFTVDWSRTPPQELTTIKRLDDASTLNISSERE